MGPALTRYAGLVAVAGALGTGACGVAIPGEAARAGVEAPPCPATRGQLVLERVNDIRLEHGLEPLTTERRLVDAAVAHTEDQAVPGGAGVGHIGSSGSTPGDRAEALGYAWALVAENVAAGMSTPDSVVAGWMDSPPHRATILSPGAVHAGVGHVHRFDGRLNHFWTLLVAAPRAGSASRPLGCHP